MKPGFQGGSGWGQNKELRNSEYSKSAGNSPVLLGVNCKWQYSTDAVPWTAHCCFTTWTYSLVSRASGFCLKRLVILWFKHILDILWLNHRKGGGRKRKKKRKKEKKRLGEEIRTLSNRAWKGGFIRTPKRPLSSGKSLDYSTPHSTQVSLSSLPLKKLLGIHNGSFCLGWQTLCEWAVFSMGSSPEDNPAIPFLWSFLFFIPVQAWLSENQWLGAKIRCMNKLHMKILDTERERRTYHKTLSQFSSSTSWILFVLSSVLFVSFLYRIECSYIPIPFYFDMRSF